MARSKLARHRRGFGLAAAIAVPVLCAACFTGKDRPAADSSPPVDSSAESSESHALADDTFEDFRSGDALLSESGAKLYVAKSGSVQLVDRLDLDGDGFLDVVLSSYLKKDTSDPPKTLFAVDSLVYWGAEGGPVPANPLRLPGLGADGISLADLDADGNVDVVISNRLVAPGVPATEAFIYWGSPGRPSAPGEPTRLKTDKASANAVADLDADGHLDIAFCNWPGPPAPGAVSIHWGDGERFSHSAVDELSTPFQASGCTVADVDADGLLDLVVSGYNGDASSVFWGNGERFKGADDPGQRTDLNHDNSLDNTVADLNGDGHLDLIFSNHCTGGTGCPETLNSRVYWGEGTRSFGRQRMTELPTSWGAAISVADLDVDGNLDVVVSQLGNCEKPPPKAAESDGSSVVLWGPITPDSRLEELLETRKLLATPCASGVLVADLDGDRALDLLFNSRYDAVRESHDTAAIIYWHGPGRREFERSTKLPVSGGGRAISADPGSLHDRSGAQTFTSRAHRATVSAPRYETLSWDASVPKNASLTLQLRSAASERELNNATWRGPDAQTPAYDLAAPTHSSPVNHVHYNDQFIQYRVTFAHDFGDTPVLDRVAISFR